MIAKSQKSVVLSHSMSLGDKQQILIEGVDVLWFHGALNIFSLRVVCV